MAYFASLSLRDDSIAGYKRVSQSGLSYDGVGKPYIEMGGSKGCVIHSGHSITLHDPAVSP